MHWAFGYLGAPWVAHQHDCWAFFSKVCQEQFNRTLPDILIDADNVRACVDAMMKHPERVRWASVKTPKEGDAVLMSQSHVPTHVGMWIDADGGGVLHCVKGAGVVFTKLPHLSNMGYQVTGFYTFTENC